jgi:hypothetical protein
LAVFFQADTPTQPDFSEAQVSGYIPAMADAGYSWVRVLSGMAIERLTNHGAYVYNIAWDKNRSKPTRKSTE